MAANEHALIDDISIPIFIEFFLLLYMSQALAMLFHFKKKALFC